MAIKDAYITFENKLDDELLVRYRNKRMPDFWKVWNSKFRRNVSRQIFINGCETQTDVANAFAEKFKSVYRNANDSLESILLQDFTARESLSQLSWPTDQDPLSHFDIACIEQATKALKLGKADGPDGLSAEHLVHAHIILIFHLQLLFYMIISHGFVPDN